MRLLLETHINPAVGAELKRIAPALEIELQQDWRRGSLRTATDDDVLTAAQEDGYIFVTFDLAAIPPLLAQRYWRGAVQPGVILISARTFRQNDIARIAHALATLWREHGEADWVGRVMYLTGR